ncbi:MAG: Gfo/Idh/MocA family oxidoreductase [Alphaproteobacteria bacterium]|nr:Gfo/Idh/MocA family oxidoreductase [Alphaproteobacteria bacterium]
MTTAFAALGRKLRLGVVGGGPGSFIGPTHRAAALLDRRFEIVAGVLSSDPERCRSGAAELGITPYTDIRAMLAAERLDAVAIMTPNDRHYDECMAALAAGVDVICDKPLTNTRAESAAIVAAAKGHVFCLTHAYTGYPMVRQARAMVAAGAIGALRAIQVEYLQAGMSTPVEQGELTAKLRWKLNAGRSGPSLVLGDIGTHVHHLVCYVTGRPFVRLAADLGAIVPGREVDDYGAFLVRLKGGVRGTLTASQALAGTENDITLKVYGELGHIAWTHRHNNHLELALNGRPAQRLARGDADLLPPAARLLRVSRGHPEGVTEAFANLYRDAAEAIAARITGHAADPLALDFPPAEDGEAGLAFVEAALASRRAGGNWVDV